MVSKYDGTQYMPACPHCEVYEPIGQPDIIGGEENIIQTQK